MYLCILIHVLVLVAAGAPYDTSKVVSVEQMQKKKVHLLFSVHSNCPGLASH